MDRIVDELLDHPRDRQLVGGLEALGGIGRGLLHVGVAHLLDVRDVVALLVILEVFLDTAEFPFDDVQTVVDEQGGVADGLVLVLHPLLVVDVQEGAENGLGTGREGVLQGKDHDGGLLAGEAGGEVAAIGLGPAGRVHPVHRDVPVPVLVVDRGIDDDPPHGRLQGILQVTGGLEALEFVLTHVKVVDGIGAVFPIGDVERETGCSDLVREAHLDRGVPVHFADAEELVVHIGGLQAQAVHDLLHEVRGGESLDFVVHVGTRCTAGASAGGGERRQVAHHGGLRILVHDDLLRPAEGLRSPVNVEARQEKGGEDAEDVPPLVVPDEGPKLGELEGLLLFLALLAGHDRMILRIVCHSLTCSHGQC